MTTVPPTATVMGFARYRKRPDASTEQLVEACLTWQSEFLDAHRGILMHRFLGNTRGHYADVMLAVDRQAFDKMAADHPHAPSSRALLDLIDPESIALCSTDILKEDVRVPTDFSCVEFGTFTPKPGAAFSEARMLEESTRIEQRYLASFDAPREHFLGRVDDNTYAEVAFVQTLGAAREICNGYLEDEACSGLLSMFEASSVDLDFWYVLA